MKLHKTILGIAALSILSFSCDRHEIIPAPDPIVEFDCSFSAIISDTISVLYTDGVDGYQCQSTSTKVVNSNSAANSSAIYEMDIFSENNNGGANIKHGTLFWQSNDDNPTLKNFEDFFNETEYVFETDGEEGVEITWYDDAGKAWVTDTMYNADGTLSNNTDSVNIFEYTSIAQESDTLDYILFEASFDCILFRTVDDGSGGLDTIRRKLTDGRFKGRFIRD